MWNAGAPIVGVLVGVVVGPVGVVAQTPVQARGDAAAPVMAFVDVAVVPMDRERVLEHQTVVVRGGRVARLGPAATARVPAGAVRVDGRGKYLIPGLADMHYHLPREQPSEPELEELLLRLLGQGVTTIRNMDGRPWHLELRARAARGELVSPRVYTSGPIFHGPDFSGKMTPAELAAREVEEEHAAGYDFLKLYDGAYSPDNPAVFDSLIAAARRTHFPIVGHVAPRLDSTALPRALAARYRSLEHLHGYWEYMGFSGYEDPRPLDEARLRRAVAETKRAGTWNTPTASRLMTMIANNPHRVEVMKRLIMALQRAGAGLLAGTDNADYLNDCLTPDSLRPPYRVGPRSASFGQALLRDELQALVAAGLTPYEALAAATRNPAEFLGTLDSTGTIALGKRADLVLLAGDPLRDVAAVGQPAGVMLGGRWLSRTRLDEALAPFGTTTDGTCLAPPGR